MPQSAEAVDTSLCFGKYLREYMAPEWILWERVLRPFRKKGIEFAKVGGSHKKYEDAFLRIGTML